MWHISFPPILPHFSFSSFSPLLPLPLSLSSPSLSPSPPPPSLPLLRFLVDVKWLKQWKKYVGYDQWDQYHVGQVSANPGPINNANLFNGTCS